MKKPILLRAISSCQTTAYPRRGTRSQGGAWGFTLIELMITLAVLGILMLVAVPSFADLIRSNRVAVQINAFVGDLQLARGEAIKQGQPVTICASSDGSTCLGTAVWETGWIVFADVDSNKTRSTTDGREAVIRRQNAWSSKDTFRGSAGVGAITYSRDGLALGLAGAGTFTLQTTPQVASATRCVVVNVSGRQQIMSINGQNCT